MWGALRDEGFKISLETVRKLMRSLGIKTTIYHKNTGKYSSYKGNVGKKAPNILNQTFDETIPYKVLHTDVTEYKLTNGKKVYISLVVDEASLEILACAVSYSPEMKTIYNTSRSSSTRSYSYPSFRSRLSISESRLSGSIKENEYNPKHVSKRKLS